MSPIVLFDLPSKEPCSAWSHNPWKTRLALNFKGVEYTTQWTEYPDIAPLFEKFGIAPIPNSSTKYTIPAVRLAGGQYVMDSSSIAKELEKAFPEPSLHLDSPIVAKVDKLTEQYFNEVKFDLVPRVTAILPDRSAEYFERTRKDRLGASLSEILETKGGDAAWAAGEPYLQELVAMLKHNGGPFFLGQTPSYADILLVAKIQMTNRLGKFEKLVSVDPALTRLFEASAKWLERDDH